MSKRLLRRRIFEYLAVLVVLTGLAFVLFPVYAYSGPGPSAHRSSRMSQCLQSAWDYARAHDGKLPANLCPEGPDLAPFASQHLPTRRHLMEQEPVPPTLWNPALEGLQLDQVADPGHTVLFYEGADDGRGNRMVCYVLGGIRSVPGPVVTDAVLRHGGVVSDMYVRDRALAASRPH